MCLSNADRCRRPAASVVRRAKTAVSCTAVTSSALNLAVVHATSALCLAAGRAHIINVIWPVISHAPDRRVIVCVRTGCRANIFVSDSVENRASHCVESANDRYISISWPCHNKPMSFVDRFSGRESNRSVFVSVYPSLCPPITSSSTK